MRLIDADALADALNELGVPYRADVLEAEYTRIDLPPVTIRKIDDLKGEKKQMVKESTPSEKAAQIEKEAVRELSKKDIEKAVEASTFGGKVEPDAAPTYSQQFHEAVHKAAGKMADENDQLREINKNLRIHIMEQNKEIRKLNKAIEERTSGNDVEILKAEILDMKKAISKMQQKHEEDISILKSELDRYKKAEQDLREINMELGGDNGLLKARCQELERKNQELKKSNAALIGIADSTAMSIGIINKLMEERG